MPEGPDGGVWYSLLIKNLTHYSSHENAGLFIKIKPIIHYNYSLKVRKVAKKSDYSLFIFFFNSLKKIGLFNILGPH